MPRLLPLFVIVVTVICPVVFFLTPDSRHDVRRLAFGLAVVVLMGLSSAAWSVTRVSLSIGKLQDSTGLQADQLSLRLQQLKNHQWQLEGSFADINFESAEGQLKTSIRWSDRYDGKRHHLQWSTQQTQFASADGAVLGEGLQLGGQFSAVQQKDQYVLSQMQFKLQRGELLTPYGYADFSANPWSAILKRLRWQDKQLVIDHLQLNDSQFDLHLAHLDWSAGVQALELEILHLPLQSVYSHYIEPVIAANMQFDGALSASLSMSSDQISAYKVSLNQVGVVQLTPSRAEKYRIDGLSGLLQFDRTQTLQSQLHMQSAQLLDTMDFGETDIYLNSTTEGFALSRPLTLPVFDGNLLVDRFEFELPDNQPSIAFEGFLTPVSLNQLSRAWGWPELDGQISGVIPAIRYQKGEAQLGGTMLVKVFGGDLLIKNVYASHLLSSWPMLQADIELKKIDLEKLTSKFAFGRITGLLNGRIENLQLENWQPTSFKAEFATDAQSPSRRISQKAVDNISNLGGAGMSGAMSRTFLRFFEDFGYDRLGLSCELDNGICSMNGVAEAQTGYYLVKGRGLPRIDVIGYNRETDWNVLLDRLVNIGSSGDPTIN